MNEKDIKKIVEELCAADRTLRGREQELGVLVRGLATKPHVMRDPDFERTLRTQLIAQLSLKGAENRTATTRLSASRSWSFVFLGIAVIAVAFAAWFGFFNLHSQSENNSVALISPATITRVENHAFGPISASSVAPKVFVRSVMNAPVLMQPLAVSASGGEEKSGAAIEGNVASDTVPQSGEKVNAKMQVMGAAQTQVTPSIAPPAMVEYVYRGKAFSQSDATLDVLKKTTSTFSLNDVAAALARTGFGSANTSSFGNAVVTNLTFAQNEDFGYAVTVDLANGNISIDPNLDRWPSDDDAVSEPLSSSSALGIANRFLGDHAIRVADYGNPEMRGKGVMVGVFYPNVVNGMEVYSVNGERMGLTVEVNARYERVKSVHGLGVQNYEASSYDAITDTARIVSLAEQEAGSAPVSAGVAIQKIGLGTPVRAYVDHGNGLLVPAFVFPITPSDSGAVEVVIVPLVEN